LLNVVDETLVFENSHVLSSNKIKIKVVLQLLNCLYCLKTFISAAFQRK
jgi:hypothetical protein